MQKLLLLPALAGVLLSACQPTGKPAGETSAAAPVPPASPDTLLATPDAATAEEGMLEEYPPVAYEKQVLPVADVQRLLTKYDLAGLWAMQKRE